MATIPSIAMIPSGYKTSKLYSVLPTDGAGDFTTTRASVATRVNEQGLIEEVASNVPRLDYSDGGCPSLLLEGTATNLIPYSEDFTQTDWAKIRATVTSNSVISPDGNLTADKLIATSVGGTHQTKDTLTAVSGDYTFSVFAKKGEYKNILLWDDTLSGGVGVNLDDLSIFRDEANQGYKIEDYGNGWIRISINHTYTAQAPQPSVYIYDNSATPQVTFTGNDVDGLYIYGASLEQNSYPTSYIKTVGTAQTRVADTASLLNLDTNNLVTDSGSWTVLFELELLSNESPDDKIQLTDVSGVPRAYLYQSSIGTAGADWIGGTIIPMNTNNKIIYRANSAQDITVFKNGVNAVTMTSTSTPIVFNRILLNGSNGAFKVKQIQVFNTTLSDTECITLTTI